jgi:hypothetical protein
MIEFERANNYDHGKKVAHGFPAFFSRKTCFMVKKLPKSFSWKMVKVVAKTEGLPQPLNLT